MSFRQICRLDVHCNICIDFRVPRPEDFTIWGSVDEQELAAEDTISTLQQVVGAFRAIDKLPEGDIL